MTLPEKYRAARLDDIYSTNLRLMSPWQLRALRVQVSGAAVSEELIEGELEQRRVSDVGVGERLTECVKGILERFGK